MSFSFSIHPGRGRWAVSQKLKLIRTLHMGEGVGEGIMLMYRCALFTKYYRGDVVARVPSVPTNVERESLKRCLMWVECLACVQTSPPPSLRKNQERSLFSRFFLRRGDVCTQGIECLVSPLLLREIFSSSTSVSPFPQKSPFQISIRFAMEGEESLRKCVGLIILLIY